MTRFLALVLLLSLSACSSGTNTRGDGEPGGTAPGGSTTDVALLDVWTGLEPALVTIAGRTPEACSESFGTWFTWGTRGLACTAAQVTSPSAFVDRAPVTPFVRGPHVAASSGVTFALDSGADFGHYDPAFVRWLADAAIPDGAAARAVVQPVYDRRVSRLAHVYWLTLDDLERGGFPEATPAGPLTDYAGYLVGNHDPGQFGFTVFAFTDHSDRLIPKLDLAPSVNDWEARYELNTAYGFWLRRRADGTHDEWADGLRRLLAAFDADWLAAHGG